MNWHILTVARQATQTEEQDQNPAHKLPQP
ncbi:hypothetical protein VAR608DRAFT_5591 [Variovorax sp. HW608]|nr:hypothetical protein VAR608DRAFT_5591 [Variovorax sp. HW608]